MFARSVNVGSAKDTDEGKALRAQRSLVLIPYDWRWGMYVRCNRLTRSAEIPDAQAGGNPHTQAASR